MLHPIIVQELRDIGQRLRTSGRLPAPEKLQQYYALFRDRFGPDVLKSVDGEALLVLLHGLYRENRNTLVYWLEFKNDEEFPFIFGSISGGSALKYGVYPSAGTGQWMARGDGKAPVPISLEQAIAIARKHRDQLLAGCKLLADLPAEADDKAYLQLQREINNLAPDICDSAWAHKYFSLLFPDKLDDYHMERYQRFHLVRLLLPPPDESGRYAAAGRFMRAARELGMPINHLSTILNERSREPYQYWVLQCQGTDDFDAEQVWQIMQEKSCLALGWQALGDLSDITRSTAGKQKLEDRLTAINRGGGLLLNAIYDFLTKLDTFDLVAVTMGNKVVGIAKVVGPYYHEAGAKIPHRRPVNWLSLDQWTLKEERATESTFHCIKRHASQLEMEQRVLGEASRPPGSGAANSQPSRPHVPLDGIPGAIQDILDRKGQVILYGPPGTGKTHWAEVTARELAARRAFDRAWADLTLDQQRHVLGGAGSLVRLCTFHPAYGYEDFLEGYRPTEVDGHMQFVLRDGIFKQLCEQAEQNPQHNFYLIVDEINRGDIPRIFGELLTLLEKNKRGKAAILPLSGRPFSVPANLFLIGTMNTADRSVALLDAALRRRFGFLELMPQTDLLASAFVRGLPLGSWLRELNRRILEHIGRDARNLQIGHAYLLETGEPVGDIARFTRILREDIIPLLEEYCYEDYPRLGVILGAGLVDINGQTIRQDLFATGREDDLIRALLEPTPDLVTAAPNPEADPDNADETSDGEPEPDRTEEVLRD